LGHGKERPPPAEFLRRSWPDDRLAGLILRSPVSPTKTTDLWQAQVTRVLPLLSPLAASARLFGLATSVDLSGIQTVKLPYIGAAGRPASVPFVGEGDPIRTVNLTTSSITLGPMHKLAIAAAITRETQDASADTAERVVSDALSASIGQSLDAALFGNAAATAIAPAGILNGLTPVTASTATGAEAVAQDLGNLAKTIAAAGINPDGMVIVTTAYLRQIAQTLAFQLPQMFSSPVLPTGQVIALVPEGLVIGSATTEPVATDVSEAASVHFEDTNPAEIVGSGGATAAPVRSSFQMGLLIIRLRAFATWLVHPGAVAFISGAAW
jgi:hypothetical protein